MDGTEAMCNGVVYCMDTRMIVCIVMGGTGSTGAVELLSITHSRFDIHLKLDFLE